jgi:hypothetical protein
MKPTTGTYDTRIDYTTDARTRPNGQWVPPHGEYNLCLLVPTGDGRFEAVRVWSSNTAYPHADALDAVIRAGGVFIGRDHQHLSY